MTAQVGKIETRRMRASDVPTPLGPSARRFAELPRARMIGAGAAALLLADLFLGWQRLTVSAGDVVRGDTITGWSGWGAKAGLCAACLIALNMLRGSSSSRLVAALGMLLFVALAVMTGEAEVGATLWPAWMGLGLAAVASATQAVPLLAERAARPPAMVSTRHGTCPRADAPGGRPRRMCHRRRRGHGRRISRGCDRRRAARAAAPAIRARLLSASGGRRAVRARPRGPRGRSLERRARCGAAVAGPS
jgi:hypothetical protein